MIDLRIGYKGDSRHSKSLPHTEHAEFIPTSQERDLVVVKSSPKQPSKDYCPHEQTASKTASAS